MIKSASVDGERFWCKSKFEKRRNTLCISRFSNCGVAPKDPPATADDLFSGYLWGGGPHQRLGEVESESLQSSHLPPLSRLRRQLPLRGALERQKRSSSFELLLSDLRSGGIVIDDDASVDALVGLGLGDLGAEDVDLDHVGVVRQEVDLADLSVVVHVDIIQGADLVQGLQRTELVVGTVDGDQAGAAAQGGQCRTLVVGEVELAHLGQTGEHGNVGELVVAQIQRTQLRTAGQGGTVGDLVLLGPELGQTRELLDGADQGISYEEFISPVFIMNAIERSLASGKEETIGTFTP